MKIVLIISARLNSNRLKNKVSIPILSLPMIECVRKRAIISKTFKNIYVATPDKNLISLKGKKVLFYIQKVYYIKKPNCTYLHTIIEGYKNCRLNLNCLKKKISYYPLNYKINW